ncbi:chemotaxis protein CheB [Stieleria marina]|uniref:protein-glutamate methylesterase n=1 Tax=Stieleria marina TaxID=1930275 RepID=A0A517NXT3_9BACT|nr:CheB methylesterase [Planctomycetes bacterium K23_9]
MIVATHRQPGRKITLTEILAHCTRGNFVEPVDEQSLVCAMIYLEKRSETVEVDDVQFEVSIDTSSDAPLHRIDELFSPVADSAGKDALGLTLSGMLSDGVDGLEAI